MDNEKIYEVEKIEFIFYDYLSFPKAERTSFYITLLNIPLLLSDFDKGILNEINPFKSAVRMNLTLRYTG